MCCSGFSQSRSSCTSSVDDIVNFVPHGRYTLRCYERSAEHRCLSHQKGREIVAQFETQRHSSRFTIMICFSKTYSSNKLIYVLKKFLCGYMNSKTTDVMMISRQNLVISLTQERTRTVQKMKQRISFSDNKLACVYRFAH